MDKTRLRWACRRGMLELDILLRPFLEAEFDQLTAEQQTDFVELLAESDQDLYAWILNIIPCPYPAFLPLLIKIRHYHAID